MQNKSSPASAVNSQSQAENPAVSVVICTRNRGKEIQAAIQSVLANQHSKFELIVVDQSTNDITEEAIQPFVNDARLRYIRSNTIGLGIARNIGLKNAGANILVCTDDDCTVSKNWLNAFEEVFSKYPEVAVVFCSVDPAPDARHDGGIPYRHYSQDKIYRSIAQYFNSYGMGAGMGLRKSEISKWGGFDESFGPGSHFRSGDDIDIALRALLNHKWVYELSSESVTHYGFRDLLEFRELTKRDFYAVGAAHAKLTKCSVIQALPTVFYNSFYVSLWMPLAMVFSLKRPRGFIRFAYYWMGFFNGIKTPVDYSKLVYVRQS